MINNFIYAITFMFVFFIGYGSYLLLMHYSLRTRLVINNKSLGVFILFYTLSLIPDMYKIIIIKEIIFSITICILIHTFTNLTYKKIIFNHIAIFATCLLNEIICGAVYGFIIGVNGLNPYDYLLIRLINTLIFIMLAIMVIYIKNKIVYKNNKYDISWMFMSSIFLFMIVVSLVNFHTTYNKQHVFYLIFMIFMVFIMFCIYWLIRLIRNTRTQTHEINSLIIKNHEVSDYINTFKTYKHNLRYNLLSIKEVGNKKTNEIIDNLLSSNEAELKDIEMMENIPPLLKHIVIDRLLVNQEIKVNVIITNTLESKDFSIEKKLIMPLYEVVGNGITNALEAIPEERGVICLNFYEKDNDQYMEIINNFKNDIDLNQIGTTNYSTKNRNSGYGLSSIIHNHYIESKLSIINEVFVMQIKVPKK